MDRFIDLPADGAYCQGPKPSKITVTEAPGSVTDADLEKLVDALCGGSGLQLPAGEGPTVRPQYSLNYRTLLQRAVKRGIRIPASMSKDAEGFRKAAARPI
jgi:hypothetical protein